MCHRYERLAVVKILHEYFALSKWSAMENMHLGETVYKWDKEGKEKPNHSVGDLENAQIGANPRTAVKR